jgi:cell division protein ZapB
MSGSTCRTVCYFLTQQKNPLYSVRMEAEFNALESKVSQFVQVCERLREENLELRQQLASAQSDARRLSEKIEGAKVKLENLLVRLPE